MLTEKILHKIHFAPKFSPTALGFFGFVNFFIGSIFLLWLLQFIREFPSAILMIIIPYILGFLCLAQRQKIISQSTKNFQNFYQKFLTLKKEAPSISSLHEQENLLSEMSAISSEVFDIPERKEIDFKIERKRIQEEIQKLKQNNQSTTFDIIYEIVKNLKKWKWQKVWTENFEDNRRIIEQTTNKPQKYLLIGCFIFLSLSMSFSIIFPIIGIINIFVFVFCIYTVYQQHFIASFRFIDFSENHTQFHHIIKNATEYWNLSQKETKNLPLLSLLFTDIINLLSQNITKRRNFLENYKKFWKYKTSSIIFFFKKKHLPMEVEKFFKEENENIIRDADDIRKFIILWKDSEIKKLSKLHLDAEIPELSLQSKRREILLKDLEKIK